MRWFLILAMIYSGTAQAQFRFDKLDVMFMAFLCFVLVVEALR